MTTIEALWMGVPVITLAGKTFAGRHGSSHVTVAGHPEFVADDIDGYVGLAVSLAGDRARMEHLRRTLRADMQRSAFLDHRSFVTELENSYLMMVRDQKT